MKQIWHPAERAVSRQQVTNQKEEESPGDGRPCLDRYEACFDRQ